MSIDNEFSGRVISYPTFTEISEILSERFEILSSAMEYGMPTFLYRWRDGDVHDSEEQRRVFDDIHEKSERLKIWPVIRWRSKDEGIYYTRFIPQERPPKSDIRINYGLFVATLAAIAIGGFMQATSQVFLTLFYPNGYTPWDIAFTTGIFILALMGIIGTHEMGHYRMAKKRGIEATPPYFLPGLPQIGGTFGAFIQQKSPPKNRSDLFDLGLAGPWAGFAVTLVALIVGFALSVPVTAEQLAAIDETFPGLSGSLPVPFLFMLIEILIVDLIPAGGTIYLHPVGFAAWVGCLVTALNLFPSGQLDGGHALRAILDEKKHKYVGYGAIAVMFLIGFYTMAILVLVMAFRGGHPGALDDTVPVSKSRILLFILSMVVLALSIPPLGLMFF
ncbi:MAG: site-2 protease family protein [Candidatus Thorarchaeota archaeon]|nr:site-2 protease family protein [Candidatus Thorarchaeota archaeon]